MPVPNPSLSHPLPLGHGIPLRPPCLLGGVEAWSLPRAELHSQGRSLVWSPRRSHSSNSALAEALEEVPEGARWQQQGVDLWHLQPHSPSAENALPAPFSPLHPNSRCSSRTRGVKGPQINPEPSSHPTSAQFLTTQKQPPKSQSSSCPK